MARSVDINARKPGRPRTTGTHPLAAFRMPPEVLAALVAASEARGDNSSISEMLRRIVTEWLRERGYLQGGD